MIKKTITYKNYNKEEETGDFYFHLSEGELTLMQLSAIDQNTESFQDKLDKIAKGLQGKELAEVFEDMIKTAYGERSVDGKRFTKSEEIYSIFKSTGAYSKLVVQLITDHDFAKDFINGLMPDELKNSVRQEVANTQSARERSEAQLQGFQKKEEPKKSSVETVPEIPAGEPVLEGTVQPEQDLTGLTQEQLIDMVKRNNIGAGALK